MEDHFSVALSALDMRRLRKPGRYVDGDGLLLHVVTKERRNWIYRYIGEHGRERWMGLGSANDVSLAEARDAAQAARKLRAQGIDPIDQRRGEKQAAKVEAAAKTTFAQAAEAYITAHASGWRQARHPQQWRGSLAKHAFPVIGAMPVGEIGTNDVLRVLQPIWHTKTETASRIRSRIELVIDYATVRGWRSGPNPAIWRCNLKMLLPRKAQVHKVEHYAALDWREAPAFWAKLRTRAGMGAAALKFAILTGARSGEVRGALWSEIDMERAIWTIPPRRADNKTGMKGGFQHRVPLSAAAIDLLTRERQFTDGSGLVFLGQRPGGMMSDMTLSAVLRRMGYGDLTVHGFRSTFRDWAAETTAHPNYVVEQAQAHAVGNAVEAAYRRGDLFAKRAALMDEWAAYLAQPAAKVVPRADPRWRRSGPDSVTRTRRGSR
jgi:integrase